MLKNILNKLMGLISGSDNENSSANTSSDTFSGNTGNMSDYKRLRNLYESDPSYTEELYDICKEISFEKSLKEYNEFDRMRDEYNDMVVASYELKEEAEDDEEAEAKYDEFVKKVREKGKALRLVYEKYLEKKYAERDKLFPEMAERSKQLYAQDLREYDEDGTQNDDAEYDDNDYEMADHILQRGGGIPGMGSLDPTDPLMQPIHGITIQDFGAAGGKMLTGMTEKDVLQILNVDRPVWDEASVLWQQRLQQDRSFTLMTLYNEAYGNPSAHPKFANAITSISGSISTNKNNVVRANTDLMFYAELAGGRQAATNFGYDGSQWVLDNYGVSLEDLQAASLKHMGSASTIAKMSELTDKKQEEFESLFTKELGPGIADDIEF